MLRIEHITNDPLQQQVLVLPDGSSLTIELYYRLQQAGWFFNNLTHGDFALNGMRVTNGLNILRQFKNTINFGLACYTDGDREPTQLSDFLSGVSKLYVLTSDDVLEVENILAGAV